MNGAVWYALGVVTAPAWFVLLGVLASLLLPYGVATVRLGSREWRRRSGTLRWERLRPDDPAEMRARLQRIVDEGADR